MSLAKKLLDKSLLGKVDPEIVDQLIEMNSMRADFFEKQVYLFSTDVNQLLEKFRVALDENDHSKIRYISHSLKGTCANFGANELARIFDGMQLEDSQISFADLKIKEKEITRKIHDFIVYIQSVQKAISKGGEKQ